LNWSDYAYQSTGQGMIVLLLILGGIMIYLLFSSRHLKWLDKYCREDKWTGEDVGEAPFKIQEGTPFTPSLEKPFDDPEVPHRPVKKKKRKTGTNRNVGPVKRKRKYTKRSKK